MIADTAGARGAAVIADSAYHRRHVIRAHSGPADRSGLNVDQHEFNITPGGHALVSAFRTYFDVDLRPVGGPARGVIAAGVCQEIDIATGELIFEWDSLRDGVSLDETSQPFRYAGQKFGIAGNPYDNFHINSIVSCASPGNCAAGGYYFDRTDMLRVRSCRGGTASGQSNGLPGPAALNKGR
jgi:hypothetical protein